MDLSASKTQSKASPPALNAEPTKRFFVRMLVRDIELVPAIVDLVDNSVDGAKRTAKATKKRKGKGSSPAKNHRLLAGYKVELTVSGSSFEIKDNCGGITLEDAVRYAFRFGRPEDVEPLEGEVGQFGVGMKRALFKLGKRFKIVSLTTSGGFTVSVNVDEWLKPENDWTFPLDFVNDPVSGDEAGTHIVVTDLLPSVAAEFAEDLFIQRLREQIQFRHSTAIDDGLKVSLNGHTLKSRPAVLLSGPLVAPRVTGETVSANGDSVQMKLYAGFVDVKDEDTDDPDKYGGVNQAGWYLICNGRLLLFADRTRLTGWGNEVADYHPQYRRFRGYVYLSGKSSVMPWNTAKTTVDEDSPIWRAVRPHMIDALREARTVMNRIKTEVQENDADARPVTAALKASKATRLADLAVSAAITVPQRPPKEPPKWKRIGYDVAIDDFEVVREALKVTTAKDVGYETFSYYYRREID